MGLILKKEVTVIISGGQQVIVTEDINGMHIHNQKLFGLLSMPIWSAKPGIIDDILEAKGIEREALRYISELAANAASINDLLKTLETII